MFPYFTKLVEQFTKILLPPNDIVERLSEEALDAGRFMKNCKYRVAWEQYQSRQRKKEAEAEDKERVAYGQIDWHDFVVVEMVDYQPNEVGNFPPPTVPEEVGARTIAEERGEQIVTRWIEDKMQQNQEEEDDLDQEDEQQEALEQRDRISQAVRHEEEGSSESGDDDDNVEDMDVSDDEDAVPAPPPLPQGPPSSFKQPANVNDVAKANLVKPDEVLIKTYDPKTKIKKPTDEVYLISPLGDNRKVTTNQANQHIHVSLLDPEWKDKRDRYMKIRPQDDSTYASGALVDQNLKTLAERRTDIFGTEETVIGRKVGEEDSKRGEKYIWDGHTTTQEPFISRQSDVTHRVTEEKEADLDRIGPQAIPQVVPIPTITIIVNTPIVTQSVAPVIPAAPLIPIPPPPPPMEPEDEPSSKKQKLEIS